jgi:hypothetical protein
MRRSLIAASDLPIRASAAAKRISCRPIRLEFVQVSIRETNESESFERASLTNTGVVKTSACRSRAYYRKLELRIIDALS